MAEDHNKRLGRFVETAGGGERVRAFVPPPLPPDPPLDAASLLLKLSAAEKALGRLDGLSVLLPSNRSLFIYMYVRKEAVLSSRIEGTQSTLSDLLRFETEAASVEPLDDIREVSNYVDAMMHGLKRIRDDGFPLSLRLVREMHALLLDSSRGATKNPGEFRTSQNWIGGSRPADALFVPPPPNLVMDCLGEWERFIHADSPGLPALLKAGLLHVQFEAIHPFLDGNGRLGRLLITLYLCASGATREPLLYLSSYFNAHRGDYYRLLQEVHERGAWEAWLEFFLDGVAQTADEAFAKARLIIDLFRSDRERIAAESKRPNSALRLHELLQTRPYITAKEAVEGSGITMATVNRALAELQALGIVEEVTGRRRNRVFAYRAYIDLLSDVGDSESLAVQAGGSDAGGSRLRA